MSRWGDGMRRLAGAPLRALLPKSPWLRFLLVALPVLILLSFVEPVVNLAVRGVELLVQLVQPLLATTPGRIVLIVLVLGLAVLVAVFSLRGRLVGLRGRMALGRHLQAVAALLGNDRRSACEEFRKVARSRAEPPAIYPHLIADACLKLARLCLEDGRIDEALAWLARVVEKGLPRELVRSAAQLRAQALWRQGEVLPETLEGELRRSLQRFPDDYPLLSLLCEVLRRQGRLEEAAAAQERVVKAAPPVREPLERQRLVEDLLAAGRAALAGGDLAGARGLADRAERLDARAPGPGCLRGEILLAGGDIRGAIRAFGATRSPEGLDLVARTLAEHPGILEPREILEACPMQGALLLVARELARAGEHDKAQRAARKAARLLGPSPTVAVVLAEVLQLLGEQDQAALLAEDAVRKLVAPAEAAG